MEYHQLRPWRLAAGDRETAMLSRMMEARFRRGFRDYWEQFGYEIGGPVCYAYARWVSDEIERRPDITDAAFVARDGWLLEQIFRALPRRRPAASHYVYAARALWEDCREPDGLARYRAYLRGLGLGHGTTAVIDTVTMRFSAQRLIAAALDTPVHGLCWVVLGAAREYQEGLSFQTFQRERYHVLSCWNLMEFIMTSPEPPVTALRDGQPVYAPAVGFEARRAEIFARMSGGVREFAGELCGREAPPVLSERTVRGWVNGFLCHPAPEDRAAFAPVMFSERADHADQIPLDPFASRRLSPGSIKDRLWLFSQGHPALYEVLHRGKTVYKRLTGTEGGNRESWSRD